ncbi:MAG: phospholipid carrier-dependent glycosyltransferase [Chloroflexota bacterium]|nr:MAG: phospholipid carrier-dependent glycosyltransferase [Chloroflexota bacterium]
MNTADIAPASSVEATARHAPRQGSRRTAQIAIWLFLCFLFLYLSTAKGALDYGDDVSMLQVTEAIATRMAVDVPPTTPGSSIGIDGRSYSKYGLGQSLLALPFYYVGSLLQSAYPSARVWDNHGFLRVAPLIFVLTSLGIVSTAATVCLLYLTSRALSFGHLASVLTALALGAGTFAWHYSRTFMSEPTSMFTALLTFYGLVRYRRGHRARWLLLSGGAAGLAILLRTNNAIVLAPLGLWLLWELRALHRPNVRGGVLHILVWSAPIAVALAVIGTYNLVRFGSVLETGYGAEAHAFTTPLHVGLYGLLLSSGKSVFVYAPILLAGVLSWFHLRRTHAAVAAVLACVVVLYILFYAKFYAWFGGGVWGPRFMVMVLPFFLLGLAAMVQQGLGRPGWILLAGLGAISVFIQAVSVLVPYIPYEGSMESSPELFDRLLWNPAYSPVLVETVSLLQRQYPLDLAAVIYAYPPLAWAQFLALLLAGAGFIAGPLVLRRSAQKRTPYRTSDRGWWSTI